MPFGVSSSAAPRWAMVSTYPPTPCGLATFTQALVGSLSALGAAVDVIRVVDGPGQQPPTQASHHLVNGAPRSAAAIAKVLNGYDMVMLQHEYGIYGGADGEEILTVLARLHVPVMTVLHTVLANPSPHQRQVLQAVVTASDALVTMTRTARLRVIESYGARPQRVHVIPHGAADALVHGSRLAAQQAGYDHPLVAGAAGAQRRPVILTWGLLGEGKGIEWGIEALATLKDVNPRPLYVVAGQTHPRVLEREGERYRLELEDRAAALGLTDDVVFDDRYLDPTQLHRLVAAADVVLLPYDSLEQVTSGVLIEAVAAGRPVVSSRFPHAMELLDGGAGLLVDQRDCAGIGAALRRVLTEPGLAAAMSRKAESLAPDLSWRSVAGRYLATGRSLARRQVSTPAAASVAASVAVVA